MDKTTHVVWIFYFYFEAGGVVLFAFCWRGCFWCVHFKIFFVCLGVFVVLFFLYPRMGPLRWFSPAMQAYERDVAPW